MNRILTVFVAAGLVSGLGWVAWPAAQEGMLPYLNDAITAQGRELYAENCASCHGAKMQGQPDWRRQDDDGYLPAPPHDRSGHTWHHTDELLIKITRLGSEAIIGGNYRSRMGGFGDILSDDEIIAILAYIKSTWPDQVIEQHNQVNKNAAFAD